MGIEKSVGAGAANEQADAAIVQVLLNMNGAPTQLVPDGRCGPMTVEAIRHFQRTAMGDATPDGRVDPGGATLAKLRAGMPAYDPHTGLTAMRLQGVMPLGLPRHVERYAPRLQKAMVERQIDTALRQAHFLAQLGHESMSFTYTEEIATGRAYEGRRDLGNTEPGDGPRFKGRGLIQLTGRANYKAYGDAIGHDLTSPAGDPTAVANDPDLAVDVACWFWATKKINPRADADDVVGVTRIINGGTNGLEDRKDYLRRAKFFFGL